MKIRNQPKFSHWPFQGDHFRLTRRIWKSGGLIKKQGKGKEMVPKVMLASFSHECARMAGKRALFICVASLRPGGQLKLKERSAMFALVARRTDEKVVAGFDLLLMRPLGAPLGG